MYKILENSTPIFLNNLIENYYLIVVKCLTVFAFISKLNFAYHQRYAKSIKETDNFSEQTDEGQEWVHYI